MDVSDLDNINNKILATTCDNENLMHVPIVIWASKQDLAVR